MAFYNLLLGNIQYSFFVIPFIFALILKNKAGLTIEAIGVLAIAIYIMIFQALYIGLMGAIIAAVLFFTLGMRRAIVRTYIYLTAFFVGICAYLNPYGYPSESLEVLLTATIYFVCIFAVHISLDNYVENIKNSKPLDVELLDALIKSRDTAHEAYKIAKERCHDG